MLMALEQGVRGGRWHALIDKVDSRMNGDNLSFIIPPLNQTLRGWFTYVRHCRRTVYQNLDGWNCGRLHRILSKPFG